MKVRQRVVVDAVVVGVAGPLTRPEALLLARPNAEGVLLPTTVLGQEGSEYVPVHPTLVVEAEAEATVMTFTARLRPHIHRFRTDLTPTDLRPLVE